MLRTASITFATTWDPRLPTPAGARPPSRVEGALYAYYTSPTPGIMALASADTTARPYLWTAPTK